MSGPVIGISAKWYEQRMWHVNPGYFRAVEAAGGLPIILPPARDVDGLLNLVDGLLLTGGGDLAPARYGAEPLPGLLTEVSAERDEFDLALARRAMQRGLPLLAICRGHHVLAVAGGGTLHQDLAGLPGVRRHKCGFWPPAHGVVIAPGTRLAQVFGQHGLRVNSAHHQAVDRAPDGWLVSARAPDGVIEAIEPAHPSGFVLSLQWHPEEMFDRDPIQLRPFAALVAAAARDVRTPSSAPSPA